MKKILLFIPLFISCIVLKAQWNSNTSVNTGVVTASSSTAKVGLISINDGNGNMIIAWEDSRNSTNTGVDIYIQKINRDGTLPWGAEKVVCNAANDQGGISLTLDGSGGVIIAWGDKRANLGGVNDEQVYGQRVNADGSFAWTTNGVNLAKGAVDPASYRRNPVITRVNSTEFIVVFAQYVDATTNSDFFSQKCLISDGTPVWSTDRPIHGFQNNIQTAQKLLSDNTGGVFVVWGDPRLATTNADIYAQKINNDGTMAWGANGLLICSATANQLTPDLVTDNDGGIVITWSDLRAASTNANIYAQRLNSAGVAQWVATAGSEGVLICSAPNSQFNPKIINSGVDFIICWNDPRTSTANLDIYAQKINLNGVPQWSPNTAGSEGIPIVTATGSQGASAVEFSLIDNGSGTAWIVWNDPRISTSDYNIYAQKLNSDGTIVFATDGILISNATGNQRYLTSISDGAGGVITSWRDARTANNGEIYASRLYANGTLPVTYASFTASKNTLNEVSLVWNIASENNTDEYLIERKGETGDFVTIGIVKAQKLSSYNFTDRNPLLENNYYRIKAKDFDGTLSYSDIRTIKIDALNADALNIYPNPTSDRLNVNITKAGKYQLKLVDQSGKIVLNKSIELNSGVNDLGVSLSSFSSGVYYLTLTNDVHYINKKIIKL
jgi:hypothetical protein